MPATAFRHVIPACRELRVFDGPAQVSGAQSEAAASSHREGSQVKRVVILTGSELRHTFLRKAIAGASGISVLRTYSEGLERSLPVAIDRTRPGADLQLSHLEARARSEEDFFRAFVELTTDQSNPESVPKGDINKPEHIGAICALGPDLLVAYGCSLIKGTLLEVFRGRFLNVHLGLSPYYRGAGTNFWALVNGEPELVGATFMHIDAGVDTGQVIHQIRARVFPGDTPHQIGNRLIADVARVYVDVIRRFDDLDVPPQVPEPQHVRVTRQRDFSPETVLALYDSFARGLVERYLSEREMREAHTPIVRHPRLKTVSS